MPRQNRCPLGYRILALLLCALLVQAQDEDDEIIIDEAGPPKDRVTIAVEEAADTVVRLVRTGDSKALKAMAGNKRLVSPWRIADELCRRGELDAADAFAQATTGKDNEKLPAYVAGQRGKPYNDKALHAYLAGLAAFNARDFKGGMALLDGVGAVGNDVGSVLVLSLRANALSVMGRHGEGGRIYLDAAKAAERIGWLDFASSNYRKAVDTFHQAPDLASALEAANLGLALAEHGRAPRALAIALIYSGAALSRLGQDAKAAAATVRAGGGLAVRAWICSLRRCDRLLSVVVYRARPRMTPPAGLDERLAASAPPRPRLAARGRVGGRLLDLVPQ